MMKATRIFAWCFFVLLWTAFSGVASAGPDLTGWYWLSSDNRYSMFYAPASVHVAKSYDGIATCIQASTMTTYSYAGAKETIESYELQSVIGNPNNLSYSVADVEINPQNRTIEYVKEAFYGPNGTLLWSKIYDPRTVKEINSQAFDETFYTAIVDWVFGDNEIERSKAADRWLTLWKAQTPDGSSVTSSIGDTTTMRLRGDNLIYWEWVETRDSSDTVQEIKFMKKAVNLQQATEKVISCKSWDPSSGWQDLTGSLDGSYTGISTGSHEEQGLQVLRDYRAAHAQWLHRYSLEKTM